MFLFATALYPEAAPLIELFQLKKNTASRAFDLYTGERAALVITGTGSINAAAGVSYLLTLSPPDSSDFFINFGCCGCSDTTIPIGNSYLIHKITDRITGMTFYPDLLFALPFASAELTMVPALMKKNNRISPSEHPHPACFFDQESAAAYQTARRFLGQHQILLFKVVSDHGVPDKCEKTVTSLQTQLTDLLSAPAKELVNALLSLAGSFPPAAAVLTAEEESFLQTIADAFSMTAAMRTELQRLGQYAALLKKDIQALFSPERYKILGSDSVPPTRLTKKEGRKYLDRLTEALCGTNNL